MFNVRDKQFHIKVSKRLSEADCEMRLGQTRYRPGASSLN